MLTVVAAADDALIRHWAMQEALGYLSELVQRRCVESTLKWQNTRWNSVKLGIMADARYGWAVMGGNCGMVHVFRRCRESLNYLAIFTSRGNVWEYAFERRVDTIRLVLL